MKKIVHNIKGRLYNSVLTEESNGYIARVSSERSLDIPELCKSACDRGRADVTPDAMEHCVTLFFKEMSYRLCDGFSINTGTFYIAPQIKGVFDNADEKFNPQKHKVVFEFRQGAELRREAAMVNVDILGVADDGLYVAQVTDVKTGSINDVITPGRNMKIKGDRLKIVGESEATGIYLTSIQSGERIKIDSSDIVINMPKELMIIVPPLPQGQYQLEVVTQYGLSRTLKEPRKTVFSQWLTVNE